MKSNFPFVSVIIPTFNRDLPFRQTLTCLFKQDYPKFEIIIIDQSDKKFLQKENFLKKHKNKLKYLFSKTPNASAARNKGIKIAKGKIVLFLDDDVTFNKNLIKNHVKNYGDSQIGAVAGRVVSQSQPSEEDRKNVGQITWYGKFTDGFSSKIRQEVMTVITCNASWRKSVLDKIGLFDENFTGPIREDSDLSLRTIKRGFKIIFDPDSAVNHVRAVSGGFRQTEGRAKWYQGFFKSETYFFLKHKSFILPIVYLTRWQWFVRSRSLIVPFLGIYGGFKAWFD